MYIRCSIMPVGRRTELKMIFKARKNESMFSTRENCPFCEHATLTGKMIAHRVKDKYEAWTVCKYCDSRVPMTRNGTVDHDRLEK